MGGDPLTFSVGSCMECGSDGLCRKDGRGMKSVDGREDTLFWAFGGVGFFAEPSGRCIPLAVVSH